MCNQHLKVYRVVLNSASKIAGDNQSSQFLVKLPYVIGNGFVHVERLTLNASGALTARYAVRVQSPSFSNTFCYETDGVNHHTIGEIALSSTVITSGKLYYSRNVSTTDIGLPINNFSLDNQLIQIDLVSELNEALTVGGINEYQVVLLFTDTSESNKMVGGYSVN